MPPTAILSQGHSALCVDLLGRPLRFALVSLLVLGSVCGFSVPLDAETAPAAAKLRVVGARVNVSDIGRAVEFYTRACGFEVVEKGDGNGVTLRNGPVRLFLHRAAKPPRAQYPGDAQSHINFHLRDLEGTLKEITRQGYSTVEKTIQATAIGTYITVKDPTGNIQQLIQLKASTESPVKPAVFNLEVEVTDMKQARDFYSGKLGLEVDTEAYYPPTIPLKETGVAPLVLQETATKTVPVDYPDVAQTVIRFAADDFAAALAALKGKGVELLDAKQGAGAGRLAAFKDPFGNVFELVEEATENRVK